MPSCRIECGKCLFAVAGCEIPVCDVGEDPRRTVSEVQGEVEVVVGPLGVASPALLKGGPATNGGRYVLIEPFVFGVRQKIEAKAASRSSPEPSRLRAAAILWCR